MPAATVPHVAALQERGIIPADASATWAASISRREAGQWMGRAADVFKADNGRDTRTFVDVDDATITRAIRAGIVEGTGEGRYEPDRTLIRGEAAVMLVRLARAMNGEGNAENSEVIKALEDVIKEAGRQSSERGKRWARQGRLDHVETGGVLTQEWADRAMYVARDTLAVKGGQPDTWGVHDPDLFRAKVVELHDNVATVESCTGGIVYHIDNPNRVYSEGMACHRRFMVRQNGLWLVAATEQSTDLDFVRGKGD